MTNRTAALVALSLVAGLLTGCGRPMATAPAAIAPAQPAVRAAAAPSLPKGPQRGPEGPEPWRVPLPAHLVIDDVTVSRSERHERITIKAHADDQAVTLVLSSFFPYYVPMFNTVIQNGRTLKLDRALAASLDKLLHAADTTGLSDRAKQGLHTAHYGLAFKAREWGHNDQR